MFLNSLRFVGYVFFIRQYRFVLTGLSCLSLLYLYFKNPHRLKKLFSHNVLLLLITCALFLVAYAFTGEFIPRYAIAIIPAYTVFCIYWTTLIFSKQISWLLITVICVLFYTSWHPRLPPTQAFEFRINEDLSYQDHITLGRQAAKILETYYPEAIIYGGFPQRYQLTEPWQGYVTHPLNFKECSDYTLVAKPYTLIYIHPYHYSQIACHALLSQLSTTLVKEFLVNGKWARLYIVNPSR